MICLHQTATQLLLKQLLGSVLLACDVSNARRNYPAVDRTPPHTCVHDVQQSSAYPLAIRVFDWQPAAAEPPYRIVQRLHLPMTVLHAQAAAFAHHAASCTIISYPTLDPPHISGSCGGASTSKVVAHNLLRTVYATHCAD